MKRILWYALIAFALTGCFSSEQAKVKLPSGIVIPSLYTIEAELSSYEEGASKFSVPDLGGVEVVDCSVYGVPKFNDEIKRFNFDLERIECISDNKVSISNFVGFVVDPETKYSGLPATCEKDAPCRPSKDKVVLMLQKAVDLSGFQVTTKHAKPVFNFGFN